MNYDGKILICNKMLCVSRVTDDTFAQQYGDGHHKFYLEFRCNLPCVEDRNICKLCSDKNKDSKIQTSRKFNHGTINEPIPDGSHIYGGKWYEEGVKKWGAPSEEVIQFALQYQRDARDINTTTAVKPVRRKKPKVATTEEITDENKPKEVKKRNQKLLKQRYVKKIQYPNHRVKK